jgi:hypothetical protein
LGECRRRDSGEECPFRHEKILPEDKIFKEKVKIPPGLSLGKVIGAKGASFKPLSAITECSVKVLREERAVMIVTTDKAKLPLLVKTFESLHKDSENSDGPSQWYIHPSGIDRHSSYWLSHYQTAKCGDKISYYELDSDVQIEELETTEGTSAVQCDDKWKHRVQPREDIEQCLKKHLDWLCDEAYYTGLVTRIDTSFGKLLLECQSIEEDVPLEEEHRIKYSFDKFAPLVFSKGVKQCFMTNVECTEDDFLNDEERRDSFSLETLDVRLTCISGTGDKLDICLMVKSEDGKPTGCEVLKVKKNEVMSSSFQVKCFHRPYDLDVQFHHYECVYGGEPLNHTVKELMGSISFPSRDRVKFRSKTSGWSITHIQHKQNRTYLSDGKWAITIADVSEHAIDDGSSEWTELEMKRVTRTEVALHNLAWECALGRDANLSPDQSLALYVEKGTVDPAVVEAVPRHWQPDDILADFQEFWDRLDTLNECLEVVW